MLMLTLLCVCVCVCVCVVCVCVCVCNHSQPVFGLGGSSDSATTGATLFFVLPLDGATADNVVSGGCCVSSTAASVSTFFGFTTGLAVVRDRLGLAGASSFTPSPSLAAEKNSGGKRDQMLS
jgi:hypothetical protein